MDVDMPTSIKDRLSDTSVEAVWEPANTTLEAVCEPAHKKRKALGQSSEAQCLEEVGSWKKGTWSQDEDKKLMEARDALGDKWAEIAKRVGGRICEQVRLRYLRHFRHFLWILEMRHVCHGLYYSHGDAFPQEM